MTASTITKIETTGRRVNVDELVALAAALGVSPVTLMLPSEQAEPVRLTDGVTVRDWRDAWRWMHGLRPLVAKARQNAPGGLSWLAVNRPYLTTGELAETVFDSPAVIALEALDEEGGDDDSGG